MEPDYVVVRDPGAPNDGVWYDLAEMRSVRGGQAPTYSPSEDFEVREDGAVAQVYERTEVSRLVRVSAKRLTWPQRLRALVTGWADTSDSKPALYAMSSDLSDAMRARLAAHRKTP